MRTFKKEKIPVCLQHRQALAYNPLAKEKYKIANPVRSKNQGIVNP
jgi:hypothetical protein